MHGSAVCVGCEATSIPHYDKHGGREKNERGIDEHGQSCCRIKQGKVGESVGKMISKQELNAILLTNFF